MTPKDITMREIRVLGSVLWSVLSVLLLAGPALAVPDGGGIVQGTVTDPAGARVPRARVLLVTLQGVVASTESNDVGEFRLEAVPAGRYELRVMTEGFRSDPRTVEAVDGKSVEVTLALRVSALTESVVVSASQVEMPLARTGDSVSVVTARDLQLLQAETVADGLRAVPGISVARNGGRGSVTSLFPRGGESDFSLVLVDGIKANAFGGGFDFSALSAADVERVEVVRGPESALFGADAMGSVIQVVTRHGGRPRAEGAIEMGSQDTRRASLSSSGSLGAFHWGASAERQSSDGFTGKAPATGETVSNDDWLSKHGSFSAGWHSAGGSDLRASVNLTASERGYPGPFGSNPVGAYTAVDRLSRGETSTRLYGARWLQPLGQTGRYRLSATANYLDLDSDFTSAYGVSASGTSRWSARAQSDVDITSRLSLSFGGEFQRERASSTFITADNTGAVPITRRVAAGFGELRLQPASRLTVTGGLRVEHFRRSALLQSADPYTPRPPFPADSRTSVNPRASAALVLPGSPDAVIGWTKLRLSAGTGMRAPDAFEIAFTDNPGLKPERSRSIEAGADIALLRERLVLGATLFHNDFDDLIIAVGPAMRDSSRYRTDNISNARSRGVEVSGSLRTAWGLDLRASYTYLDTEIRAVDGGRVAPAPFAVGDDLLRRPRHQGSVDAIVTRGQGSVFARLGGRGAVLDVEPSWGSYGGLFRARGYRVVDAGASWRFGRTLDLFGRVGNLFDREYEETYGFPALGRNLMIGVRIAAGR